MLKQTERSSTHSEASVFTLQSHEIEQSWPWIKVFLSKVPSYDWTVEDVKRDLMSAKAQLWAAADETEIKGIWITRIENSHTKKWGLIWIASGSQVEDGIRLMIEHTEPWFREQGCEFIQIAGRAGWSRVLEGYEEKGRIYVKDLR